MEDALDDLVARATADVATAQAAYDEAVAAAGAYAALADTVNPSGPQFAFKPSAFNTAQFEARLDAVVQAERVLTTAQTRLAEAQNVHDTFTQV